MMMIGATTYYKSDAVLIICIICQNNSNEIDITVIYIL